MGCDAQVWSGKSLFWTTHRHRCWLYWPPPKGTNLGFQLNQKFLCLLSNPCPTRDSVATVKSGQKVTKFDNNSIWNVCGTKKDHKLFSKVPIRWLLVSHWPPTWIFCYRIYFTCIYTCKDVKGTIAIGVMSIAMNVMLTNMYVYCTASKRTLLQRRILTDDHPAIMFCNFFHEKYLLGE